LVTARYLNTLVDLWDAAGNKKFLRPLPAATAFLEKSLIGPKKWARLCDLKNGRPIYGDRNGKILYRLEEISKENRKGYCSQGVFGIPQAIRRAKLALKRRKLPLRKPRRVSPSEIKEILHRQDAQG